jgi:hypothetical protein
MPEFTPFGGIYKFDAANWGSDAIIVAGGNDGTPGYWDPKVPNPCFVYYPDTDEWVGREKVPEPVLASYLGSLSSGGDWKLIVAAGIDTLTTTGSPGENTQIFTETLGGSTFPLALSIMDGWNMVSVPGINPGGMGVSTWWPGLTGSVFAYSGGYTIVTTTTPTEGYWMKHSGSTVYNYPALQIVPHNDVPLVTGWNLIGLYENSVPTGTLTTSPPGIITGSIFGFNGGYVVAATIDPGYAYWVKATGPGVITGLTPPPSGKEGKVVELFKEDWGKITITDATGKSFTLYAVDGEVNLENYEMPPMAPAEVFDIRYESNRIAEDLNSEFKAIQMTAIEYPITVKVENMDLRLQDETGKLVDATLKSGEDITISKQVSKLMVTGEVIPDVYALEQNYPNPFNPTTVIEFSLPENVKSAKLTIYNALGEKVAELVNTSLEAGRYSYQWDASNVATGMYIYELRADKFVSIKKMLLLK